MEKKVMCNIFILFFQIILVNFIIINGKLALKPSSHPPPPPEIPVEHIFFSEK